MNKATELTITQFYTNSTCGEACWEAREEICHCSCHGRNHGILNHGGDKPQRNCKIDGQRYILHSITNDYNEAKDEARRLMDEICPGLCTWAYGDMYRDEKNLPILTRKATETQKNWIEVQGIEGREIYLIWMRPAGEKYITKGTSHSNDYKETYPPTYATIKGETTTEPTQPAEPIPDFYSHGADAVQWVKDNPAAYPMIEGEGAPQYTFALPAEPTQLALL